jgi:hypothetical protein
MHKYLILFFSVTLFLCACKSNGIPNGIIKPDAMTGLLTEIHLIDGSLYSGMQSPDTLYKYGMGNYLAAFERFHTDSATFKKSMDYYSTDPDRLSAIYDQVDIKIKALLDSVNLVQTKIRKAAMRTDSLKADSVKKAQKKMSKSELKADSLKKTTQLKLKAAHTADSVKKAMRKMAKAQKADSLKKVMQKMSKPAQKVDSIKKVMRHKRKTIHIADSLKKLKQKTS